MEEPVSSLYGPGAIICWLCTTLSVLLSWCFNHSSRKHDTFTSDFVACLLLPAIAITHLVYELSHTTKTEDWKATPIMDATFTICMGFAPFGFMLCYLALSHRHKRKFVLTAVVTVACWVMVLVGFAANRSNIPRFDKQNALLPLLMSGCAAVFFFLYLLLEEPLEIPQAFNIPPSVERRVCCILVLWLLSTAQFLGFGIYFCGDDNCKEHGDDNNKRLQIKGRLLPQTPYSIGDIDQAVALSIGIVTLLLSIRDMIQDFNFPIEDEFEYWRTRCVRSIECGDTKVEVARWKEALETIDKISKWERTRARHRKREHETYEKLPKDVKRALEDYIRVRYMVSAGFLY